MGRLFPWIDRAFLKRRGKAARKAAGRCRPLAFEKYEPRLALSAATPSVAEELFLPAELLAEFRVRPIDATEWLQASMGRLTYEIPSGRYAGLQLELALTPSSPDGRAALTEGGVIAYDSTASPFALDSVARRISQGIFRAAFDADDSGLTLSSDFVLNSSALTPQIAWIHAKSTDEAVMGKLGPATADWLEDSDATFASEDDAHLTSSPILRITVPLRPAETEGGTIDLTGMAGPTSLVNSASSLHFAMQGTEIRPSVEPDAPRLVRPAPDLSIDNMRARAVVYEVALEHPGEGRASREIKFDAESPAPRQDARPTRDADLHPARRIVPLTQADDLDRDDPIGPEKDVVEVSQFEYDASSQKTASNSDDSARQLGVIARDAALANWNDGKSRIERAGHSALAFVHGRSHQIGLAIALMMGGAPLIKRVLRPKPAPIIEQTTGLW